MARAEGVCEPPSILDFALSIIRVTELYINLLVLDSAPVGMPPDFERNTSWVSWTDIDRIACIIIIWLQSQNCAKLSTNYASVGARHRSDAAMLAAGTTMATALCRYNPDDFELMQRVLDATGAPTSTSFWTIFRAFFCSTPPHMRCVPCSTW